MLISLHPNFRPEYNSIESKNFQLTVKKKLFFPSAWGFVGGSDSVGGKRGEKGDSQKKRKKNVPQCVGVRERV